MQSAVQLRWSWALLAAALLVLSAVSEIGCGGAAQNKDPDAPVVLYVSNQELNSVSAYNIKHNGSLSAVAGSPFPLGGDALIAEPDGKVLYSFGLEADALQLNSDHIAEDGSLKMSSSITDDTLAGIRATNPTGTALYVASISAAEENWGWKVYSIQPGGALQFVDGLIDQAAGRLVFTPDGTTAFAAYCYQFLPNIEQFAVASNGMLRNLENRITANVDFGECPNAVALTPSGNMLAAPWSDATGFGSSENFITLFNVDPTNHELKPAAGSISPASGAGEDAIFDSSGKFLIVGQDNGVGVYNVGQSMLTEVRGSPFGEAGIDRVVFTPTGKFLVALSRGAGKLFVFSFENLTGSLTPVPGSPVSTPDPYDLAVVQR